MKTILIVFLSFTVISFAELKFEKDIKPLLKQYCYKCHDEDVQKGDLRLDTFHSEDDLIKERKMWLKALELLETREMPPKKPFPQQLELEKMMTYLDETLHNYDWSKIVNPGFVPISRLTKREYENSVCDVFQINFPHETSFGKESEGASGFTNDRNGLAISRNSLDKYIKEASNYVDAFFSLQEKPFKIEELAGKNKHDSVNIGINRGHQEKMKFPFTGLYKMTVRASSSSGNPTGILVTVNSKPVFTSTVNSRKLVDLEVPIFVQAGEANVMTYLYRPMAAVYEDKRFMHLIPEEIYSKARELAKDAPKIKVPEKYKGQKEYEKAYERISNGAARVYMSYHGLQLVLKMKETPDNLRNFNFKRIFEFKREEVLLKKSHQGISQIITDAYGFDLEAETKKFGEMAEKRVNAKYGYKRQRSGNLMLNKLTFEGPFLPEGSQNPEKYFKMPQNETGARKLLEEFCERAFREKFKNEEVDRLVGIYKGTFEATGNHQAALRDALVALFISPKFLLHKNELPTKGTEISAWQKANRLSYFLWGTLPDAELRADAKSGNLNKTEVMKKHLKRMVADKRFAGFTGSFTRDWINISGIANTSKYIEQSMLKEPELLLKRILQENRSIYELVDAGYTYVNEVLARIYELPPVKGDEMQLVSLKDKSRGGLLTMGALLRSTSLRNRTSPVIRGNWVIENIFGEELPPPPNNVPELDKIPGNLTVRQKLEQHRKDPNCAGCHSRIDPYGVALENYDMWGRWRNFEDDRKKKPVDSTMIFRNGSKTTDIASFKENILKFRKDDIRRSLIENILSYALGRNLEYYDEPAIRKIIDKVKREGDRGFSVLEGVIESYPFNNQMLQKELAHE